MKELGAVVTGASATMVSMEMASVIAAGVVGFGAAYIVLGTIDLFEHKNYIYFTLILSDTKISLPYLIYSCK